MTPRTQNKAAAIVNEDYDSVTHELVHRLEQLGWILVKASGSHLYFSHNKSHWRLHIIKYEGTHRAIKIARISDKNDSISLNLDPTPRDTNDPVVIAKYMSRVPTMSVQARRSWTLDLLANRKLKETSEDQNTMTKIKKGHHRMKSSKKVNEGFWDALVGQTAAAGMQALGQRGLSTKEKLTQNIFIKDFVADAVGALTNAIEGGIVDTSIAPPPESQEVAPSDAAATDATPAAPGNTAQAKPAAPAAPAAPGPAAPAAPGPAAPANTAQAKPAAPARPASSRPQATNLDQKYNTVLGSVRKLNTTKGTRPLPASVQTQIQADIQKAKYNKDWAVNTGEKIAALAGRGYNVQGLQQDWIAAQSSGKRQGGVMESYSRLNHLFEQILEATGGQSIEKFMNNWFAKYMSGIDYSGYQDHVDKLIKQIAATYSQDEGVRAITGLAKAAYAISKASGTMPADNKAAAQPADNKPAEQPTNNSNPATKPTTPNNMDLSNLSDSQLSDLLKKAYTEYEMRKRGNKPATGVSESRRR